MYEDLLTLKFNYSPKFNQLKNVSKLTSNVLLFVCFLLLYYYFWGGGLFVVVSVFWGFLACLFCVGFLCGLLFVCFCLLLFCLFFALYVRARV